MDQQELLGQTVEQFIEAIKGKKLVPPKTIEMDGQIHHFASTKGDAAEKGWYILHGGRYPRGAFGDFRAGVTVRGWTPDRGRPLTEVERKEEAEEQKERGDKLESETKKDRDRARSLAKRILLTAKPARPDHDYLVRKRVAVHGVQQLDGLTATIKYSKKNKPFLELVTVDGKLRFSLGLGDDLKKKSKEDICKAWTSCLLTPMLDEDGFQSVQLISKAGDKKFLYGAKKQGCFSVLGDIRDGEPVLMAEGFATAATVREATGLPVVIAYDAGNMPHAARTIRKLHPYIGIVVCGDDDFMTVNGAGEKNNPGATKAKQAAAIVGGEWVLPVFTLQDRPPKATDFNDMAALEGKVAVVDFFKGYFSERNKAMTHAFSDEEGEAIISRPANTNLAAVPAHDNFDRYTVGGTILDYGTAPYQHKEANKPTFFIDIKTDDGDKTLWGVDLGKALDASGLGKGDKVVIRNKGKARSETYVDVFDQNGVFLRKEPRTINKNVWQIDPFDEAAAEAIAEEAVVETRKEQLRLLPERSRGYEAEPAVNIKVHFSQEDFNTVQKIWKGVPHRTSYHTENGYHLVVDEVRKVVVTKDRIELARKPRHRLDQHYAAACEHARQFWDGQMEVQGDNAHRVKAWAYATVYGVEVTNFVPNDRERLEAEKIMASLRKDMEPSFSRPSTHRGHSTAPITPKA